MKRKNVDDEEHSVSKRKCVDEIIEIPRLEPQNISPFEDLKKRKEDGGAIYLVIGPSGSGKSRIISSLLFEKHHFIPLAIAISESETFNNAYEKHIPQLFINEKLTPEKIEDIQNRQLIATDQLVNPWCTMIMDDCMNKTNNLTENIHVNLFKISRHQSLFTLVACQAVTDLKPTFINQCAGYFILRSENNDSRKKIYEKYASVIPDKKLFNALMDKLTSDNGCLFIYKRSTSSNWRDKVFWYKAPDLSCYEDWKAVSNDVIAFNKIRFDEKYSPANVLLQKLEKIKKQKVV
jgi:energy-coupling factor transporter ATP-binding protein EcfA2